MYSYSKQKPQHEGFYWIKFTAVLSGQIKETIVKAYKSNKDKPIPDVIFWDGENTLPNNECFLAFAGPIAKPQDENIYEKPYDIMEIVPGWNGI
jgi:hypothetical protein